MSPSRSTVACLSSSSPYSTGTVKTPIVFREMENGLRDLKKYTPIKDIHISFLPAKNLHMQLEQPSTEVRLQSCSGSCLGSCFDGEFTEISDPDKKICFRMQLGDSFLEPWAPCKYRRVVLKTVNIKGTEYSLVNLSLFQDTSNPIKLHEDLVSPSVPLLTYSHS